MTKKKNKWTRRAFIGVGGLAGIGLVVGIGGNYYINKKIKEYSGEGMGDGNSLNAFVRIAPDNTISIAVANVEMGQGTYTSLPQLVAEELEVEMSSIKVVGPQPESPYANTFMMTQKAPNHFTGFVSFMEKILAFMPIVGTGGSSAIGNSYDNMRTAGATAREMLKTAAAQQWNIDLKDCKAEKGFVINNKGEKLSYGELAEAAAKVELKELPKLKNRSEFTKIGKPVKRLDIPAKTNGTAEFGLDVRLENMLYAAFRHPKVIGGKITALKNEAAIAKMRGVKKIMLMNKGVAVIADNTWRANSALKALETEEDDNGNAGISTESIKARMDDCLAAEPIRVSENIGDTAKALAEKGIQLVEARYDVPFLAHATMEPMNCTVLVKDGKCEAWVGHQFNSVVKTVLAETTGVDGDNIRINTTFLGGGFGRRSEPDFVRYAAAIAREMEGIPVQTSFSREEDMRNDMYRPAAASQFKATVNGNGEILAWDNMIALQSVSASAISRVMPMAAPGAKDDAASAEGAAHLPYKMANRRVAFGDVPSPIQLGFWRSVGHSHNAFFKESFMDECAHAAKQDPYEFRRTKITDKRHLAVLDKVAEMSNWKSPAGENRFRGIALHKSFGSIVAEVAEIEKVGDKEIKLVKYYCAIDCGNTVNPDTIKAQMEGGIVFGLSAALFGAITWKGGAVVEGNFPQYEMVRLQHCPEFEVFIMDVDAYPGGVGEPGTPPAAPALTNAIFAATGDRLRSLPLKDHGYTFV